jgi:hypothetical protein
VTRSRSEAHPLGGLGERLQVRKRFGHG